jgi:hypothetical protein
MSDQNSVGEGYREARHDGIDCLNPKIQIQKRTTGKWVDRQTTGALFPEFRYRVPVEPEWYYLVEGDIMGADGEEYQSSGSIWLEAGDTILVGQPWSPGRHAPRRRRVTKPEPVEPVTATTPVQDAIMTLGEAMRKDSDFAWTWHCNVAMAAADAGAPVRQANERAADFMRNAFGVDIRASEHWAGVGLGLNYPTPAVDTVTPVESSADAVKSPWAKQAVSWFVDLDPSDPRYQAIINDPVYQPAHYTQGPIECVDWVRLGLTDEEYRGWLKGNALSYIFREKGKGGDQDLDKASRFLTFHNRPQPIIKG